MLDSNRAGGSFFCNNWCNPSTSSYDLGVASLSPTPAMGASKGQRCVGEFVYRIQRRVLITPKDCMHVPSDKM